jgi:hypothetical protein
MLHRTILPVLVTALAPSALAQPVVVSHTPARNALNIPRSTAISITFDRAVDPATISTASFNAFGKNSGPVAGSFAFSNGNQTVTLDPAQPFAAGETVIVVLSHDIRDSGGAALRAAGYSYQFVTATVASRGVFRLVQTLNDRALPGETTRLYGGQACDLNNDGYADLTMVNEVSADLRVFLNRADGTGRFHPFLPPVPNEVEASPNDSADFNLDGHADICTSNTAGSTVSMHLGNGDGTFQPRQVRAAGSESHGIATLDVDGDGDLDIVNANHQSSNLALFINNGAGSFSTATMFEGGGNGEFGLAAGDMNNDGIMDLVAGHRDGQTVAVLRGNGNGTFTSLGSRSAAGPPWMIALGDLNGDGNLDVTIANSHFNNGAVLLGNGNGTLQAAVAYGGGSGCVSTDLADVDGDGDLDWLTAYFFSADFRLFINNGLGQFTLRRTFSTSGAGSCVIMADFNNDGDVDLSLVDELTDIADIYENYCPSDWNSDSVINSQDFFEFLGDFFAGIADFNADGQTTSQDFFDFLAGFFAGC